MHFSAITITKVVFLNIAATGVCLCMVPPQPIPSGESREKYNDPLTPSPDEGHPADRQTGAYLLTSPRFDYKAASGKFGTTYFPYIFSTWVVFMSTLDTFHALDLFPHIMPIGHKTTTRAFNTQLIIGLMTTIAFSTLRIVSFQTLGRFFTYQLSILPDHKLVTHGLYSYVRHPSYTAILSMFAGVLLTVTAPGNVLYDSLGVESTERLMILLALAIAYGTYVFAHRASVEDQVLRKEFGREWEEWARVVRYKFIPGVL